MHVVWNLEEPIPHDWLPPIMPKELDQYGEFELVRCLFTLTNMTAEEAEAEAAKLKGPFGTVVVLSKSRQVYITDLAGKVRAIRDVIDPVIDPNNLPQFAVLPLGSLDATTVQNVIASMLPNRQPPILMSVVTATNSLAINASVKDLERAKALIYQLGKDGSQMKVFKLKKLDPSEAMLGMNSILASTTNPPKLHADSINMKLVVFGSKSQIAWVEDYLTGMGEVVKEPLPGTPGAEIAKSTMRVIPLIGKTSRNLASSPEQLEALVSGIVPNRVRIVMPNQEANGSRPAESFTMPRTDAARARQPAAAQNPPAQEQGFGRGRGFGRGPEGFGPGGGFPGGGFPGGGFPGGGFPGGDGDRGRGRDRDDDDDRGRDRDRDRDRSDDRSTQLHPGYPLRVLPLEFVAVVEEVAPEQELAGDEDAAPASPEAKPDAAAVPAPGEGSVPAADQAPAQSDSQDPLDDNEVVIVITPSGWIIRSNDTAALDRIEEYLTAQIPPAGTKEFSIFYLKYARAEVAAALLNSVLTGSSSSDSGGGSLAGDLASGMMGNMMGGMFGNMFGGGGGGGGGFNAVTTSGSVSVLADPRLNALYVQASPSDLDTVEKLLQLIDQAESPDPPQTMREPRAIPVRYANVDEVATVVRQVYANRIASEGGQQRQFNPEDFIRQAFQQRGGRGGGGGRQQAQQGEEQKMTIGVDTGSNTLFVAAPDYLFKEVETLVSQLDQARSQQEETVSVVKLDRANPDVVARSLSTVLGTTINSNSNRSSTSSS
ncbi:MAG: secretin N-terminal domain-containing protein, partial [Pirellulaceae bacterium]